MCPPAQIRENTPIRCVLVHELTLLRQGLRRLLEDEPDLDIVAEAENAAEALRAILEYRPEIVITDVGLFRCPPAQVEQMILRESPNSRVVFLPASSGGLKTEEAWRSSSGSACVLRQTAADEFVKMVRAAAGVQEVAPPEVARLSEFPPAEPMVGRRGLTAREQEVLKLLAEGRTVRSVAGILGLSIKTVDAHKFNLMRKLGIHNKAELVMWAIQKKVVKLPVNF